MLRLGVQDFELLKMLERVDPVKARSLAEMAVHSITEYERDQTKFEEVRRELITSLMEEK
jgi:hypothetical protein